MDSDTLRAWDERDDIEKTLHELIRTGRTLDPREFEELACRIWSTQTRRSPLLRRLGESFGAPHPRTLAELPPVPAQAFRMCPLLPLRQAQAAFRTSGTTTDLPGIHEFESLDLYRSACVRSFQRFVTPDWSEATPVVAVYLMADPGDNGTSSLAYMLKQLAANYRVSSTNWLAEPGPVITNKGLETFRQLLTEAHRSGQRMLLCGPAFAYLALLDLEENSDQITDHAVSLTLPTKSRIVETGGFKGRTREIARNEFHQLLSSKFAVPLTDIINEYGMTELTSQFYDGTQIVGHSTDHKQCDPWLKAWIVDPVTGERLPPGQVGAIRIFDLLNLDSSVIVQTEDGGMAYEDGFFSVLGRLPRATPRGCSLPFEPS